MKVCAINPPAHYKDLLADGPKDWIFVASPKACDAIHLFITDPKDVKDIPALSKNLPPATMLWISWPKKSSALSKSLSEDDIRKAALACGLVDIKVCAVDADWSGLKLTRRRA
jgi:hypothetical protein